MNNMKAFGKELGYPHELLVLSSKKAEDVLRGRYRNRTKILAALFLSVQGHKVDLKINVENELYLSALLSLAKRTKMKTRKIATELNKRIEEYIHQFEMTQSSSAFSELKNLLVECIYLHLVSKEILGISILSQKSIEHSIGYLEPTSELKFFLTSLQLAEKRETSPAQMHEIISAFISAKESPLIESALLLSFILAIKYSSSKSELLLTHYSILKTIAEVLGRLLEHQKLDDPALQQLFTTSVVLFLCGYTKSLRLSHEEKINYVEKVIAIPLVEREVERNFEKTSKIKVSQLELPLWGVVLAIIILIFLHVFAEVYVPGSVSLGVVSFTLPPLPIFLTISFVLLLVVFYKILKFKHDLISRIRKGDGK
jgi:hypothetical protein